MVANGLRKSRRVEAALAKEYVRIEREVQLFEHRTARAA
jgi:hypothetical protein